MHLFELSKNKKEKLKALEYEGVALAAGEYGLAAREAEALLPKNVSMKLMSIL
jgi:hypothetical protein